MNKFVAWLLNKIPHDQIGPATNPYMCRYFAYRSHTNKWLGSIRIHHILRSDDDRDLHDHPFDFVSFILTGGYAEVTPEGRFWRKPLSIVVKKAKDLHRLELKKPMWTFVITGPFKRKWGFQTKNGWVDARNYPALQAYESSYSRTPISTSEFGTLISVAKMLQVDRHFIDVTEAVEKMRTPLGRQVVRLLVERREPATTEQKQVLAAVNEKVPQIWNDERRLARMNLVW